MVSRQELKKALEKNLSASRFFTRVDVKGDLSTEWCTMYLEYQKGPKVTEKEFEKANKILKQKLESVIKTYFFSGIVSEYEGPDDNGRYRAVFGRQPSEVMGEESTDEFLKRANEHFRNKYLFNS